MAKHLTTEEVIQRMLEDCNKKSQSVADETGINYSTFMRKVSPFDEATWLSVMEMIPYMRATGSTAILDHINERMGRMYVPFPRGIRKGTDPKQDINKYSSKFMNMVSKMMNFAAEPTEERKAELMELIRVHQGDTENMRRRVRDNKLHQTEMDLT